jgi:hypothetical protein
MELAPHGAGILPQHCCRRYLGRVTACHIVRAWPASAGQVAGLLGEPSRVAKSATEQELDLRVRAAQLIAGPADQGIMDRGVQAQ